MLIENLKNFSMSAKIPSYALRFPVFGGKKPQSAVLNARRKALMYLNGKIFHPPYLLWELLNFGRPYTQKDQIATHAAPATGSHRIHTLFSPLSAPF